MPWTVGDDEPPPRGGEVAVGDVDRDPLLALGPQAVGEQREVERSLPTAALAGLCDVLELVLEDLLRVVQQPPDERALPVSHRAGGAEAQQVERHRQGVPSKRPREPLLTATRAHLSSIRNTRPSCD